MLLFFVFLFLIFLFWNKFTSIVFGFINTSINNNNTNRVYYIGKITVLMSIHVKLIKNKIKRDLLCVCVFVWIDFICEVLSLLRRMNYKNKKVLIFRNEFNARSCLTFFFFFEMFIPYRCKFVYLFLVNLKYICINIRVIRVL